MEINRNKSVKLSVCVVTYNQENYIAECIQSLVDQKTNFDFEIIVGDDCSTDKTTEIVRIFENKYPHLIRLLLRDKNVGAAQNFMDVHHAATGDYVAHIDGDDYALADKFQVQVDFMDSNPRCNLSWHRMLVEKNGELRGDLFDTNQIPKEGFSRADILKYITIGMNSSKMYRAGSFDFERPNFPILDYFANVEQVGDGFASFVSGQPLGVYRAGIGIASNGMKIKCILNQSFRYFLNKYPEYTQEINQAVLVLLLASLKNLRFKEIRLFSKIYFRSFRFLSLIKLYKELEFIKMLRLP